MRLATRLLKMAALVYVMVSLAFGLLAWMMSGSLWQFFYAAFAWPAVVFK